MDIHWGCGRRVLAAGALAMLLAVTLTAFSATPAFANVYENFCVENYAGGQFCNQSHEHSIVFIEAQASADAFCVMRANAGYPGAPSPAEYCAGGASGGFVYKEFFGLPGFAQTHNRHSYNVSATPAFEYH